MTADDIVQALAKPFPIWELSYRGKETGYECVYADGRTFTKRLSEVLPLGWSFRLENYRTDTKGAISCEGVLTLHLEEGDRVYTSTGTERPDADRGDPKADKGADTDAFKRACFRAGIGMYIYNLAPKREYSLAEVRAAARIAGYRGEITWEQHGTVGALKAAPKEAAPKESPSTPAADRQGGDTTPEAREPAENGPAAAAPEPSGVKPDAYALRDRYNQLCRELMTASGHADQAVFMKRLVASGLKPATAAAMPAIIRRLEGMIGRLGTEQQSPEGVLDPFEWDARCQSAAEQGKDGPAKDRPAGAVTTRKAA